MANKYFRSFLNKDAYDAYVANTDLPSIFVGYCVTEDEVVYLKDSPAVQPFTITAITSITIRFRDHYNYSTDNGETWGYNEGEWTEVNLQPDETLQLRGNFNEQISNDWIQFGGENDRVKLSGNIMSLYYADAYYKATLPTDGSLNFWGVFSDEPALVDVSGLVFPNNAPDSAFREMFTRCGNLVNAGFTINAKNSGVQAFLGMFNECFSLTTAPTINVKKICREGMTEMFQSCSSLVNAPDLSSITGYVVGAQGNNDPLWAVGGAFKRMFNGCSSLTNVPVVPIVYRNTYDTTYESMFEGCSSLVVAPEVTITGANYDGGGGAAYANMFKNCSSLSDTSKLKFSTEDGYIYFYGDKTTSIFDGCTSLTNIRFTGSSLPNNWPSNWLDNTTGGTITIDAGQSTSDWESALGLDTSRWTCVEAS